LFRRHKAQLCQNRIITCPNHECGQRFHQKNLKFHLQEECVAAVNRKQLLQYSSERKAKKEELESQILQSYKIARQVPSTLDESNKEISGDSKKPQQKVIICPQCGEGTRESQLSVHMKESCFFRPVACPNYGIGCHETAIPLHNVQLHLIHDCKAEKLKEEMIIKSRKRNVYVQCSTCGYQVELRNWQKHERELCENRLVPCKNHSLGCNVMVPLTERNLHELIDESYERYCLYVSGHGSYIHIQESDIICPWTAEVSEFTFKSFLL
jgi:DNA-directed RNA polymerase subunit M/transcription elongation factor TFIIS